MLDLMNCPGAWYGNNPDATGRGNLTVATPKIIQALAWLRRRGLTIVETRPGPNYANGALDRGVSLSVTCKAKGA